MTIILYLRWGNRSCQVTEDSSQEIQATLMKNVLYCCLSLLCLDIIKHQNEERSVFYMGKG